MTQVESVLMKRARLMADAAVQRERLARQLDWVRPPLALADCGLEAGRWLAGHPRALIAGAAAFMVLAPGRAIRIARRGFIVWRGWRWITEAARRAGLR